MSTTVINVKFIGDITNENSAVFSNELISYTLNVFKHLIPKKYIAS